MDGALLLLLLLLQAVLVITTPIWGAVLWAAVLPVTRVAHHTWKTKQALLSALLLWCWGATVPAGWPEKNGFPFCDQGPPNGGEGMRLVEPLCTKCLGTGAGASWRKS